jgi:hypothetical protein
MQEFWLYIILGFLAGLVFEALCLIGFVKRIIQIGIERGKNDD